MTSEEDLELALLHIKCMSLLLRDNEYEKFIQSHLIPVEVELKRQLTNLTQSTKIKE